MRFATQTSGKCKLTWKQTSSNTAAGLTAANVVSDSAEQNAIGALITVETNDIRYTLDGETTPESSGGDSIGHVMPAGGGLFMDDPGQIQNFNFISKTAGSAGVLHISSFFAKL